MSINQSNSKAMVMVYRIVLYVGLVYYEAKAYRNKSKYIKSFKLDIHYVDRFVL